jgi:hypothetical protein
MLAPEREMVVHVGVGRLAGIYTAQPLDDARALFMFRTKEELHYHYRDVLRQQELLREACAGMDPKVDGWLAELDRTPTFYFDSITQLQLDTWSRGSHWWATQGIARGRQLAAAPASRC